MKQTPQPSDDSTGRKNNSPSTTVETTSSVGWTDISDRRSPADQTAVDTAVEALTIPAERPDPEETLFRDTTSVIRFLEKKRTDNQFELRLYHADDESVADISPVGSPGADPERSCIDALPQTARQRFEDAVGAVTEQFSLSVVDTDTGYGQCCHRRPHHGFCGVLEFRVTLEADDPTPSR